VSICSDTIQPDDELENFIDLYCSEIDQKYSTMLCRTAQELTHPSRIIETSLVNLFADMYADNAACDVAMIGNARSAKNGSDLGDAGQPTANFPL
jgi:5'-nucleotidase